MKRRDFLQAVGGMAGGLALGAEAALSAPAEPVAEKLNGMPLRVLGRTGCKVSIVGFPGLALNKLEQEECNKGVHAAFDKGINYFDVAPAYGVSEEKMGVALQGLDRDKYFLACKTKMRDGEGAIKELERSLTRLKTDHFDLYQLHHLRFSDEVKKALGPGGAMEALLKAREQGKIKHFGFSAHTTKGAIEVMKGFRFDTAMFPINFVDFFRFGFGKDVLDLAAEQGVAVLAIKALSRGLWPKDAERTRSWWYRSVEEMKEVDLALRFALSQKGVVSGFTPSFLDLLDKAIDAAKRYEPITAAEVDDLREIAKNCVAVFEKEDAQAAIGHPGEYPLFAQSPHECGCHRHDEHGEHA